MPGGSGLQHQLDCFGDGHEIAGNPRMRNGDGAAAFDLLFKDRHDTPAAAQHIAEAHRDIGGRGI